MDTACPVCPEEAAERNHAGGMPGRPLWTQPARYAGTGRYEWEMTT
jgi:hypothetical protein